MDAPRTHVLVVDDEPNVRKVLAALLEQAGHDSTRASSADEALALVRSHAPDIVLTDLQMPGGDGIHLLRRLRAEGFGDLPVVVLTAHGTVAAAVEAMRLGAFDFLEKPFDREHVLSVVAKATASAARARQDLQGTDTPGASPTGGLIGSSAPMVKLRELIGVMPRAPSTVVVTGETGTGKELVARALHALSPRASQPFIAINCGALPETLVESELFGHARGAFTGADRDRPGRIELAHGGTLFLDEIGELPLSAQVKLLRVFQDGVVDPLGSTQPRQVDVRVVAATHRDLDAAVGAGTFRQDLRYRLCVMQLEVPSLRERRSDIPELARHLVERQARRLGLPARDISNAGLAALAQRDWPGNVRELANVIERALLLGQGDVLGPEDFGPAGAGQRTAQPAGQPRTSAGPSAAHAVGLKDAARAAAAAEETRLIQGALTATGGNVTRAAEQLGLSRRGLQLKLKELSLRAD